jgi:hypothetical protein
VEANVFGLDSTDPQTWWLNATNLALGVVIAICVVVMLGGIVHELVARFLKRRRIEAEIDRDMQHLDDGVFRHPELGATMADGGEPLRPAVSKGK